MADKTETITAHVMALTTEKLGKFFDTEDLGDKKRLERWHNRLSALPNDPEYIDGLFDPFYGEKQMPEPSDIMAGHWRNKGYDPYASEAQSPAPKQLQGAETKESVLAGGAKSPHAKELCALIANIKSYTHEDGKLDQDKYYGKIKELAYKYGTACASVAYMKHMHSRGLLPPLNQAELSEWPK